MCIRDRNELYTHTEYTFFRGKDISAPLVYSMLLMVLLIVPAINISVMTKMCIRDRLWAIAAISIWFPARQAMSIQPAEALHGE